MGKLSLRLTSPYDTAVFRDTHHGREKLLFQEGDISQGVCPLFC